MNKAPGRVFKGLGAAPGRAAGQACVVRDASDGLAIPLGSILVIRIMHPHLAPFFTRLAGVVVEEGALLQHATTLAHEFGVPAVVGVRSATTLFHDGDWLEINSATGEVIQQEPSG